MKVGQGRRQDTFCEEQGDFVEVELILETRWWPWSVAMVCGSRPRGCSPVPEEACGCVFGDGVQWGRRAIDCRSSLGLISTGGGLVKTECLKIPPS